MVLVKERPRLYSEVFTDHLRRHRQMALVSGPRQVGKTTACRSISDAYLNWDNIDDRRRMLRAPATLADALQLDQLRARAPIAVLDELHK
jgi:predicted AAA+ superfamily ATPase